jgi:TonB family protein
MKNLLILFVFSFLIISCNQRSNQVEVIKLNDNNYLPGNQVDNTKEVFSTNYSEKLYKQIDQEVKDKGLTINGNENYSLSLFVNESGSLDKIIVLNAPNEKNADIMTDVLSKQNFAIGKKDDKPVKYNFDWNYSPGYSVKVDNMPTPIGGINAIQKNIVYPEIARRAGIEGKVYVTAYINEAGVVTKTEVIKGIGGGCDEAAVNAIKKVKFNPGMEKGVPVKVQVSIPVVFRLANK